MIIGCVKEIKDDEYRVGISPESAKTYIEHGHEVLIEKDAGLGSGFSDQMYKDYGASVVNNASVVWQQADLMIKVKEPIKSEYKDLKEGAMLFTYLHLAADKELTQALLDKKVTSIAYETVQYPGQGLPLLKPMSVIAGRLATQQGAKYLERTFGGKGVLLSGVDGSHPAEVMIVGAGNVARNAIYMAYGMGAHITVIGNNVEQLQSIAQDYPERLQVLMATPENIEQTAMKADLLILSALVVGASAPVLITRDILKKMEPGTVMVDVSVDQGGCAETTRPTTHHDPIYIEEGVVHYCVANMPGAVPRSASLALNYATLPFALEIANKGIMRSVKENEAIYNGVNTYGGHLVYEPIASSHNMKFTQLSDII
jgi:alanine dehydrogenase